MDENLTFYAIKRKVVLAIAESNDVPATAVHIFVAQERHGYSILELDKISI